MKGRSFLLRCAAFFLLLVFSQKVGVGLFLHELLHETPTRLHGSHPDAKDKRISFSCSCLDDLQMPFIEKDEPIVQERLAIHQPVVSFYRVSIPFYFSIFSSLRGPPHGLL